MKKHNDVTLLTTPTEIATAFGISVKSRSIYRTYMPTKDDAKLHNRPTLEAMDIYTYLQKHDITQESLIMMVTARRSAIDEIMGKIK